VEGEGIPAGAPAIGEPGFLEQLGVLAPVALSGADRVDVLVFGDSVFDRMEADIRGARRSVAVQMYYCEPGRVARRMAAALAAKAREGVPVYFLWDTFGCGSLGGDYFDALRRAGVHVAAFRPIHWYTLHRAQHRSHVRAIVVDGVVGYTGGTGFADKWLNGPTGRAGWRDTSVRVSGPVVRELAAAFATAWTEATGVLLAGPALFPPSGPETPRPRIPAGLVYSATTLGTSEAERFLALTIAGARRTLWITNSYFLPNKAFRDFLRRASRRGVDVRVLVPGTETDVKILLYAGQAHYEELMRAGIRVWEYQGRMVHAKTIVADGVWTAVGTLNLDNRSLRLNDEATLAVYDPALGATMDSVFLRDLGAAREVRLEAFRKRPWTHRVWELLATRVASFL
jgi:cardiolipin synthase